MRGESRRRTETPSSIGHRARRLTEADPSRNSSALAACRLRLQGETALDLAKKWNHFDVVKILEETVSSTVAAAMGNAALGCLSAPSIEVTSTGDRRSIFKSYVKRRVGTRCLFIPFLSSPRRKIGSQMMQTKPVYKSSCAHTRHVGWARLRYFNRSLLHVTKLL